MKNNQKQKTNWQTKKLGEVCGLIKGKKPKSFSDEGKEYLTAKVIRGIEEPKYTKDKNAVYIQKDDVFIIMDGSNSGELFRRFDGALASTMGLLKIDRNNFDINFLLYFLKGYRKEFTKSRTGSAIPHLNKDQFNDLLIPVIPLSEQHRIVGILDGVFGDVKKAREKAEKNLANAKELFESYLQSVFENPGKDWEEKRLGETCVFFNGKAHEKIIDDKGNYIVVNSKFISRNGKILKRTKKQLFPLFIGDIAMVMSDVPNGKALAKCFLVDEDNLYSLNQRICVIRSEIFDNKFLYWQLNRNKYFLSFNNGENQTNLRKNDILNCPLFVPPLSIQKQIVRKLDELSAQTKKLEDIYQQKIDDLEELKKSVLKKAFAGEL